MLLRSQNAAQLIFLRYFILAWAFLFGTLVRLYAPARAEFPILDGGLFYIMTQDILDHHFSLPVYTSFNRANIPFAYPPITFYLAALITHYLPIDLLDAIRWFPPLIATATIPAFYLLGRSILNDALLASLATLAFAMLPATFDLFIMGGGLTRSWGMLFSILTLYSVYRLYTYRQLRMVLQTAVFASLLVTGHPETTFHTFFIVCLIWLFKGRDRHTALLSIVTAALVLLFTLPWWLTVWMRHGLSPFVSALQSGWHHWLFWAPILKMDFAGERFVSLITVLGIIGFIAQVSHKSYFLPVWLLLPFAAEPRNPNLFASFALCMLAAIGFQRTAQGMFDLAERCPTEGSWSIATLSTLSGKLLLGVFMVYPLVSAFSTSLQFSSYHLTREQRQALEWIREHTPGDSRFIILAFQGTFANPFQEWLPSLTGRVNVAVEVGYEWMPGGLFEKRRKALSGLSQCLFETVECVEAWAERERVQIDYTIVYQALITPTEYKLGAEPIRSMTQSPNYRLVYQSDTIKIFRHTQP